MVVYAGVGYPMIANDPYGETAEKRDLAGDAVLYLEGRYAEDLSLQDICDHLEVSRSALTIALAPCG